MTSEPISPTSWNPATRSKTPLGISIFKVIGRIVSSAITRARRIVDFRNQLTHEYPTVDDALVWAIVETDVPVLKRESADLINRHNSKDDED